MTSSQPENSSPPPDNGGAAPPHLEAIRVDGMGTAIAPVPELMTEEEFFTVFSALFPIAGGIYGAYDPPELQSLVTAPDLPTARPAFAGLYRICQRYDFMRWMIEKNVSWLADAIAIGAFGGQVYFNVRAELDYRQSIKDAEARRAGSSTSQRRYGNWKVDSPSPTAEAPQEGNSGGPGGRPGVDPAA